MFARPFSLQSSNSTTRKPTVNYTSQADRRRAWAALVDFYSDCEFSRVSDKMIALAGLAEEMRNATKDIYLAGLWKKDLHSQLCWSTDNDVRRRVNRSTVPMYLAPTWSWTNANGPVIRDKRYCSESSKYASFMELLNVSVHSEHSSGLHSFVASSLAIRGIAVWARAILPKDMVSIAGYDTWLLQPTAHDDTSHKVLNSGIRVNIIWDENISGAEVDPKRWPSFYEERKSDLLCMLVYLDIESSVVGGLLLRRLLGTGDEVTYVRMGTFCDYELRLSGHLSARLGYPSSRSIAEDIDLDNPILADLVYTVTVI